MKKLIKSISTVLYVTLSACSSSANETTQQQEVVVEESHDYDEVSDYELIWETIFDVDSSLYYVYFYSPICNHCEEIKNYMISKALEKRNIYFIKASSRDQITNDQNISNFAENPWDIWILGYPSLIQISNKKCTKNLAGISQIKQELK